MTRSVSILGATGSVGLATLDLIAAAPAGQYAVTALTANTRAAELAELALRFRPRFTALSDPRQAHVLEAALAGSGLQWGAGASAVAEAASMDADWTMAAIVGAAGLAPTLAAVKRGKVVALANKEALVCAGPLFMESARLSGATILPVDSEHNAIFQALGGSDAASVRRIILTASGGPFRNSSLETMARASVRDAVAHPVWSMGAKISVDSATMMNKGLEVIEACHLFALPPEKVDVIVHPESIVHGLVEHQDGGLLAQMGTPDMRTPIAHALGWPDRMETRVSRLDLPALGTLTFEAPDPQRFPALDLARAAFREGGASPVILNAANEIAVDAFLNGHVGFLDIAAIVADSLEQGEGVARGSLTDFDTVYAADAAARELAVSLVKARARRSASLAQGA
ncbi:1-deoxy-D-xylulose-5-phosphate reductoisomerase [Glycocaulis alkaliphilus]|uniref:1-deoxy-D-xylulose 5-phosphate reductoisomerase n=1 Tax=Glycocaulis alkaliphilus TaxID=1434191 RepID=A0A3T0EA70_9PROT|nr:1-deoxy-D-xylulose-5-phosphate reductoisomerase [Glycocaulis alkaliphilus]AZU04301.1 1-deoxy-D-xylulose-5-phosphate reductoisomerase [Glycocaulis alkaliphilus]GGB77339.1 1-deoxy-D-xylulose 5-phosphate reductoisomerase [Glycocaulis alkaliphilus]